MGFDRMAAMIALDTLSHDKFEAHKDEIFSLVLSDGAFPLTLSSVRINVKSNPNAKRDPFALTFKSEKPIRLPQGIYTLENEHIGQLQVFLVQVGHTEVEAVFN